MRFLRDVQPGGVDNREEDNREHKRNKEVQGGRADFQEILT